MAYLLKVSAGTIVLYLCFVLFFRKDTFYMRNRVILILTMLVPLILPLIRISTNAETPVTVGIIHSVITVGATFNRATSSFDYKGLILAIWLVITFMIMLRTIIGIIKTVSIIKNGDLYSDKFPKLVISDRNYPAFSFGPYAVIPRKIFESGEAEDIITHENAHIRQGHTMDLIFCELYTAIFWYNPIAWLIKKSVRLNHEFLADHELTACSADIKTYQYRLLDIPEEFNRMQLAHSFNNLIKNRIVMINKKQTNTYATWKNLLIIPAVALIFAAFSCDNAIDKKDSMTDQSTLKSQTLNADEEVVYNEVEQMPVFPGGERAMMKFIQDNLKYPETAQVTGVQGTVVVNFVIDKNGKVTNSKVYKGVQGLDDEALKVINQMPHWTPGKKDGKAVAVSYTIPIKFVLN